MSSQCDVNTQPGLAMGNPASDPDAFATMGLITDGSNLPLIFINGFGQVISDSKIAARFEIIHNNQLDATNNPASNQLNRIPAQLTSDDFDRSYLTEIATRPDGDAGVSKPGYDFEPKVPTTITITATAGPDNTTLCSSMVFQFYDNGEREIETKISKVEEADEAVLGMPEEDDWVMHGPLADKTLMRNVLAHYLMGQISNRYAPKTRWAEVFLTSTDDGFPGVYNYQGVYVFTEEMEVDSNRINIGKPPKGKRDRNTLGFGYLFEVDNTYASVKSNFTSIGQNSTVYFDYIDPTYYEVEHEFGLGNYARQIIGDFETVLSRLRKDDPLSVLESQMDVDSFVDFFLITELAKNQDGYRRNTFFYKDAANNQGKFTMGPVTSYGRAFGNADSCGGHQITGWQFVCGEDVLPLDRAPVPFWWRKLTNNAAFVQRLQARWSVLAGEGGALELTAINRFIDSESAKLKSHGAVVRNERKWHSLLPESIESGSGMVTDSERNNEILIAYDREINQLKNWFRDRAAWLDVNLSNLGGAIKTTDTPESISSLATTVSKNSLMTTPGLTEPVSSLAMTAVKPISSSVQVTATELSESGSGEKTSTPMEGEGSGSGLETSFTSQSEPTSSLMAESSAASVDASSVLASSTREADISSTQSMLSPTALPLSSSDLSSSVPGTEPSSSIAVSSAGAVRSDGGGVSTPLPEPSSSTQAVISTEIDELDSVAGVSTAVEEEPASSSQVVASTESGSGSGFETTFITKSEPTSSLMTESSTASVDASSMLISSTRGAELSSSQSTAVSTVLPQTPSTLPSSVQMGDSSSSSLMVSSSKSVGSSSELVLSSTKGSELYTSPTVKMSTEALEPMPTDGPTSGAETIGGGITLVMALLVASVLTVF